MAMCTVRLPATHGVRSRRASQGPPGIVTIEDDRRRNIGRARGPVARNGEQRVSPEPAWDMWTRRRRAEWARRATETLLAAGRLHVYVGADGETVHERGRGRAPARRPSLTALEQFWKPPAGTAAGPAYACRRQIARISDDRSDLDEADLDPDPWTESAEVCGFAGSRTLAGAPAPHLFLFPPLPPPPPPPPLHNWFSKCSALARRQESTSALGPCWVIARSRAACEGRGGTSDLALCAATPGPAHRTLAGHVRVPAASSLGRRRLGRIQAQLWLKL